MEKTALTLLGMMATFGVWAALEPVSPKDGAELRLLTEAQRKIMGIPSYDRRLEALQDDAKIENKSKRFYGRHNAGWRRAAPFVVRWIATAGEKGPWKFELGKTSDLSDAKVRYWKDGDVKVDTHGVYSREVELANLEVGATYHWRITANVRCPKGKCNHDCLCKEGRAETVSSIVNFRNEDMAPRWMAIEGSVGNIRDLGGRKGKNERIVQQGFINRSQGLNQNSVDGVSCGKNSLTISDAEYLVGTLGIRTDLDLRCPAEVAGMNGTSPLGASVNYINNSSSCYDGIFSPNGKKVMARNFRVFTDPSNYPILFHCIGGADRTGALAYVLNGVLGVCRRELETDWESTFYPTIPDVDSEGNPVWNSGRHDRIVLYLKDCGIGNDEIERFRRIMLK